MFFYNLRNIKSFYLKENFKINYSTYYKLSYQFTDNNLKIKRIIMDFRKILTKNVVFGGHELCVGQVLNRFGYKSEESRLEALRTIVKKHSYKQALKNKKVTEKSLLKYISKKTSKLNSMRVDFRYSVKEKRILGINCKQGILKVNYPFGLSIDFKLDRGRNNGNIMRKLRRLSYWQFVNYYKNDIGLEIYK